MGKGGGGRGADIEEAVRRQVGRCRSESVGVGRGVLGSIESWGSGRTRRGEDRKEWKLGEGRRIGCGSHCAAFLVNEASCFLIFL